MNHTEKLVKEKKRIVARYSTKSDRIAAIQLAATVIPYGIFWYLAIASLSISYWLTALCGFVICLLLLRVFVLMHECGHNALFATSKYNRIAGFFLGVLCGMPQYVWARNHAFHHATNGNWDQYRGPLATLSIEEYQALSKNRQRLYQVTRNIAFAPVGGFLYLIFNPRYTWLKGTFTLLRHILGKKRTNPKTPVRSILQDLECRYWRTAKEYWHMTGNNLVLLALWLGMSLAVGAEVFFTIYLITLSLAGAGGIILFTVQHNFEGSWAANEAGWDYNRAAIEGTSFLVLPAWLNWFTANIAYHHIHHLSASIPNYNLAKCHREYEHLFTGLTRISLGQIPAALRNNLWDVKNQRITSPLSVRSSRQNEEAHSPA